MVCARNTLWCVRETRVHGQRGGVATRYRFTFITSECGCDRVLVLQTSCATSNTAECAAELTVELAGIVARERDRVTQVPRRLQSARARGHRALTKGSARDAASGAHYAQPRTSRTELCDVAELAV